jgi:hypothetical protein
MRTVVYSLRIRNRLFFHSENVELFICGLGTGIVPAQYFSYLSFKSLTNRLCLILIKENFL